MMQGLSTLAIFIAAITIASCAILAGLAAASMGEARADAITRRDD
jgi:F0F1-type ATP synthase membrane subunit c/vacuolar-type H+-ATPase subunit K